MSHPHILFIRFSALGDVAMLVPIVHALATQHPEVRVTVLSRPFAKPLFENIAPNVGFMGADLKTQYNGIRGLNKLYRRIVAKKPTHIADCHGVLRTYYLRLRFNLGHFKVEHIDKHRKEKRALIATRKTSFNQLTTSFQNYADVVERLGFAITPDMRSIFGDMRGNLRLLPDIVSEKKTHQQWVGIAPFATHKGKIYPLDKMEQVVRILSEKHPNMRIFLFHGRGEEAALMAQWEQRYKNVSSASALLGGIGKELILMSHLNVMLSMDSSNMHLASLVACPVVSVWGATHRYAGFLGWNQRVEDCIELDLPCRPCSIYGNHPCLFKDYHCLNISPETIVEKVEAYC